MAATGRHIEKLQNMGRGWFEFMTIIYLRPLSKRSRKEREKEPKQGTS